MMCNTGPIGCPLECSHFTKETMTCDILSQDECPYGKKWGNGGVKGPAGTEKGVLTSGFKTSMQMKRSGGG